MIRVAPVLALACSAVPLAAQAVKLNGPLARGVRGSIGYVATSPDGLTHVYPADLAGDGRIGLYATASSGKEARHLVSPSTRGEGAYFAPDGKRVLHAVDLDGNGAFEVAVVPIDGSAPDHALTGLLPAHASAGLSGLAPDGVHFVYLADTDTDEVVELHGSSLDGGAPVKLSGALVPGGDVLAFVFAGQAPLLLYLADQEEDETLELYVASLDGSQPARKLPIPLVAGGDVGYFELDGDASHALYVADQEEDERFELFSIATDGSEAPVKLSQPLVAGGDIGAHPYFGTAFASYDRRWVVYSADALVDEEFGLYAVPADGSGPPVELVPPAPSGAVVTNLSWDSRWVVFALEAFDPSSSVEYFSVPIDGSAPARPVSGPYVPGGGAYLAQVSYDSTRFVYVADQDTDEVFELYSTPIDGSAPPVKLSAPLVSGGDVAFDRRFLLPGFYVMTDGVMYLADQEIDGRTELYFVPQDDGAPPRKLASAPVDSTAIPDLQPWVQGHEPRDFGRVLFSRDPGLWSVAVSPAAQPTEIDRPEAQGVVGGVTSFRMDTSGGRVVYLANEEGDLRPELDSVPPDKPQLRVPLGFDLAATERVDSFELAAGATRVVFRMFLGSQSQIFSVPAAGGEAPRTLGPALGPGDFVGPFELAPDGATVVFYGQVAGQWLLFASPADGSAPVRTLALLPGTPRAQPKLSTDGSRVAILLSGGLHALPFDGGGPVVRLSTGAQQVESDYQVTPDGATVVYRTAGESTRLGQLFAAPGDGSAAARRLSDAIAVGQGDVRSFLLAPDGTRAVYRADAQIDERFELFSVPVDGSAPAVRLHPALVAGGDVLGFRVSADSRRVIYQADQDVDERFELFGVPLDGGRPSVRISVALQPGGRVLDDFQLSPDAQRVVYRARRAAGQGLALFSSPIQSSRGGVRLSYALVPGGSVQSFRISADSSTVAFTAERNAQGSSQLLVAPIGGNGKAVALAGPFTAAGTIQDYDLSADGRRVVYRADQETLGVFELYAATFDPPPALSRR